MQSAGAGVGRGGIGRVDGRRLGADELVRAGTLLEHARWEPTRPRNSQCETRARAPIANCKLNTQDNWCISTSRRAQQGVSVSNRCRYMAAFAEVAVHGAEPNNLYLDFITVPLR